MPEDRSCIDKTIKQNKYQGYSLRREQVGAFG